MNDLRTERPTQGALPESGAGRSSPAERQVIWDNLGDTFSRRTDRLGYGIEPGILETVVALNALGIQTSASCEGHIDRGAGAPWVDIRADSDSIRALDKAERSARRHARDLEKLKGPRAELEEAFDEWGRVRARAYEEHVKETQKVFALLEEFYRDRQVPYDRMLIPVLTGRGGCRIHSLGGGLHKTAEAPITPKKLAEYQEEMLVFTQFLKGKFFAEG